MNSALGTLMILLLARALVGVLRADGEAPDSLQHWKEVVRAKFPKVRQLPTAELALRLADTNSPAPLLLDVRKEEEFRVSRIPGAVRVDPDAKAKSLEPILSKSDRPVVVYCSVGWRSSALAQRLTEAGHTNVSNLEGSIFVWANEGRRLVDDQGEATKVHPYNRTFGRLLHPERRAEP